jgi:hypothetical protein
MQDVTRQRRSRPLVALRAGLVVFGGPLALIAATVAAAADATRALREARLPRLRSAAMLAAAAAYAAALPGLRGWGATPRERRGSLAGDEAVPRASVQHTRAVTIDAPPEQVWPWLAQIGQDRGGFYSYTWLENLAGCRMRNADRVHPEWQDRRLGDLVLLHPTAGLEVIGIDAGRSLTLEDGWSFVLEPQLPDRSRLLARWRFAPGPGGLAFALLIELPHHLMERRMLLGIKRRAQRAAQAWSS